MPIPSVDPIPPVSVLSLRVVAEDAQEASYFAASARIVNLSISVFAMREHNKNNFGGQGRVCSSVSERKAVADVRSPIAKGNKMTDEKQNKKDARDKMKEIANKSTMASSKALQDDALTKAEKPIKTKLDG